MTENLDLTGREPSLGENQSPITGDEPSLPGDFALLRTLGALQDIPWGYEYRGAGEVREDRLQVLHRQGQAILPALIEAAHNEDIRIRTAATQLLGQIGDPAAIPVLVELLRKTDIRFWPSAAAMALVDLGALAEPVLLDLLDDPQPVARNCAIYGLGALGNRTILPKVQACLRVSRDRVTLNILLLTLMEIGDGTVLPELEALIDDTEGDMRNVQVQDRLFSTVWKLGGKDAADSLIRIYPHTNHLRSFLTILGQTGDPRALGFLSDALMTRKDPKDLLAAVDAIMCFDRTHDVHALIEDAEKSNHILAGLLKGRQVIL